jgi:hypothetical protein
MIEPYLEDLERRIEPAEEQALYNAWVQFVEGKYEGEIFSPRRTQASPAGLEWPHVPINDALDDMELMALQQLGACSQALAQGTGAILAVRSNYGTGIMSTLFGADLFLMDREMNTLPTSIPLGGLASTNLNDSLASVETSSSALAVKDLLARGIPNLRNGLGARVFDMADAYSELFAPYPKLQRYVHVYHPDMQGPMDICELLWGSSIFVALVEAPDLVIQLLELVTDTYIAFMHAWTDLFPFKGEIAVHWSMVHKGNIMLRDDSAMNLSPRMFDRFIKPYDERLLKTFGGGAIHFCGRGDHYIRSASEIAGLTTINMSQPEYNNMDTIFAHTVDKGIAMIGLQREAAEAALAQGRDLHGRVHCW